MKTKRKRKIGSVKSELLKKSREAALAAIQIFNNPNIRFKSESYIVLMIIAWTYLLHSYYRNKKVEYRYFKMRVSRKRFDRTNKGAYKYWELEKCLNAMESPIDKNTSNNLRFLIGLRHEIEHQMTTKIDDLLSARFQACCLNYNEYIQKLFGNKHSLEGHLSFSLQLSSISREQKDLLSEYSELPSNIQIYIEEFDQLLSAEEYGSQHYAYRILFVPKTANRIGQADRVIEFVKSDSDLAKNINKAYTIIKETEKPKYLPSQIVEMMNNEGYPKFTMHYHTKLWKMKDGKNEAKSYGTKVAGKHWHWYLKWIEVVRIYCKKNQGQFK